MYSLAFDPAARYSGAALLDGDGALVTYWTCDFGAQDKVNPQTNLRRVRHWANSVLHEAAYRAGITELYLTVENLSHFMTNPAPALRAQAVILDRADCVLHAIDPVLVMPPVWQNALGWHKSAGSGMTSKKWAKWLCESLGYDIQPTPGSKASEDARDAVLIARWRLVQEEGRIP